MNFEIILKNIADRKLNYGNVGLQIFAIGLGTMYWEGVWLFITIPSVILFAILSYYFQQSLNHEVVLKNKDEAQQNFLFDTFNELLEGHDLVHEFYENLIENSTMPLLEELGFKHDPCFRLSLYTHLENSFTMLFRYSDDPHFKRKGRAIYSDNEGVIGEAYHRNSCVVTNLPDPKSEFMKWKESQLCPKKGRMKNQNTIKNLTMMSRSLIALPIRHGNHKHMVAVFESTEPDKLDVKKIEKSLNGYHGLHLKYVLSRYRLRVEPSISIAERMRL